MDLEITKCEGDGCPLKGNCFRYSCESDEYMQSWLAKAPYDDKKKSCDMQIKKDPYVGHYNCS